LGAANADGKVAKMSARESAIFELVNIVCLGCAEVKGLPYENKHRNFCPRFLSNKCLV